MLQALRPARSKLTHPGLAAALFALAMAAPARADLLDTISVDLVKPNGVEQDPSDNATLTQLAPLATGILAGASGDIGNFMLGGEAITFSGQSILIHVAAGSIDGLHPGYGDGAHYLLTGLAVAGEKITGLSVYAFDGYSTTGPATGLDASVVPGSLVQLGGDAHSVSFELDNGLKFVDRGNGGSYNYAEFRIDLQTQPVPEPGSWLMMLAGLGGVSVWRARRRHAGR